MDIEQARGTQVQIRDTDPEQRADSTVLAEGEVSDVDPRTDLLLVTTAAGVRYFPFDGLRADLPEHGPYLLTETEVRPRLCSVCGRPVDHTWKTIYRCKEHHYAYLKERRQSDPRTRQQLAEKQARYRERHREKVNAYNAEWLKAHPEVNRRNAAKSRARKRKGERGA